MCFSHSVLLSHVQIFIVELIVGAAAILAQGVKQALILVQIHLANVFAPILVVNEMVAGVAVDLYFFGRLRLFVLVIRHRKALLSCRLRRKKARRRKKKRRMG